MVKGIIALSICLFLVFSFTFNYSVENQLFLAKISQDQPNLFKTTVPTSWVGNVNFTVLSELDYEGFVSRKGLVVENNYAYIAGDEGILIVNVSDVTNLSAISIGYGTNTQWDLAKNGNFVYVANNQYGLSIYNVTDINHPEKISQYYDGFGWSRDVVVKDDLAYIADCMGGLDIVNVSDPLNPVKLSECIYPNCDPWGINITDDYAYLADTNIGLIVVNISNPKLPVKIGQYQTGSYLGDQGIAVKDDLAIMVTQSSAGRILNISDPTNPRLICTDYDLEAQEVVIQDNIACFSDGYNGIKIFDIRNPANPVLIGEYDSSSHHNPFGDMCVRDNILYVVQRDVDLMVLEMEFDIDGDGLTDEDEINIYGTDPYSADPDNDLLSDSEELAAGTDPFDADTDSDGLTDGYEVYTSLTDPTDDDCDNDGLSDGMEVIYYGTNPNNSDSDGDSYSDFVEIQAGTDPNDPEDYPGETPPTLTPTPPPTPSVDLALNQSFIGFSLLFLFSISTVVFLNQRKK